MQKFHQRLLDLSKKSWGLSLPHVLFYTLTEVMFSSCICWLDFPYFPFCKQAPVVLNETFHKAECLPAAEKKDVTERSNWPHRAWYAEDTIRLFAAHNEMWWKHAGENMHWTVLRHFDSIKCSFRLVERKHPEHVFRCTLAKINAS